LVRFCFSVFPYEKNKFPCNLKGVSNVYYLTSQIHFSDSQKYFSDNGKRKSGLACKILGRKGILDKMSLFSLLLVSLPEALLVTMLGFQLAGLKITPRHLIGIGAAQAVSSYFIRLSSIPFGLHTLVQVAHPKSSFRQPKAVFRQRYPLSRQDWLTWSFVGDTMGAHKRGIDKKV
jgi:hypothetical protein